MIKELSKSQLNSFKGAEWPVVIVKMPGGLGFRTQALKTSKLVIEFLDVKHLLHLAEVLSSYFVELQGAKDTPAEILAYLKQVCSLGFKLNNLVPLERHNFGLFCAYISHFYSLAFDSPLH
jgi:hypothetical protein